MKLHSFLMKPQEGTGCPSAPLRRGPDGLEFQLQGTMLSVASVSTKYLSFINSSVKTIKPAFAGKCIAVAVACVGLAAEPKWFGSKLVFQPSTGRNAPVSLMGVIIVKYIHAIARVLKGIKVWQEGGDFWGGRCHSFCCLSSRRQERGSYFAVLRRLRLQGRGRPEHPTGRLQPSPWLQLFHGRQLLPLLSWTAAGRSKTLKEKIIVR